jgi:hypothetical protein
VNAEQAEESPQAEQVAEDSPQPKQAVEDTPEEKQVGELTQLELITPGDAIAPGETGNVADRQSLSGLVTSFTNLFRPPNRNQGTGTTSSSSSVPEGVNDISSVLDTNSVPHEVLAAIDTESVRPPQQGPVHSQEYVIGTPAILGGSQAGNEDDRNQIIVNVRRSGIGGSCRTTTDCLARTDNSVCFSGHCLCNLRFHYSKKYDYCSPDPTCPTCNKDQCVGGMDVYCNGTCYDDYKKLSVSPLGGHVKSPGWPATYAQSMDKFFCLEAPSGKRITINFKAVDLPRGMGLAGDWIKIYNGCTANDRENLLGFYHGDNLRSDQCMTSKCNKMMVHFHTGSIDHGRTGFYAAYREVEYEPERAPCAP